MEFFSSSFKQTTKGYFPEEKKTWQLISSDIRYSSNGLHCWLAILLQGLNDQSPRRQLEQVDELRFLLFYHNETTNVQEDYSPIAVVSTYTQPREETFLTFNKTTPEHWKTGAVKFVLIPPISPPPLEQKEEQPRCGLLLVEKPTNDAPGILYYFSDFMQGQSLAFKPLGAAENFVAVTPREYPDALLNLVLTCDEKRDLLGLDALQSRQVTSQVLLHGSSSFGAFTRFSSLFCFLMCFFL
jgi:hypothetical protein